MTENGGRRHVRSFVRREGRITPGQQRALSDYWPQFGVDLVAGRMLDLDALFGRGADQRVLEIGFGNGDALLELAARHPERDYLGVEVHRPGVGRLLHELHARELNNVRVVSADAVELLRDHLRDACLQRVQIFFPDPWPKKRHHKRRLIQPNFINLLARRLRPGGVLHVATDWEPYAEHMLAVLSAATDFSNFATTFSPRPPERPQTRFERRGLQRGYRVHDLLFERR